MVTWNNISEIYLNWIKYLIENWENPKDNSILIESPITLQIDEFWQRSIDIKENDLERYYKWAKIQFDHELSFYKDELYAKKDLIIKEISNNLESRKLYFNLWKEWDILMSTKSPCLTGLYFRVFEWGKINMSCIMRANNAFKISFINFMIFGDFFLDICTKLDLSPNKYIHHSTSYHIYKSDLELINESEVMDKYWFKTLLMNLWNQST